MSAGECKCGRVRVREGASERDRSGEGCNCKRGQSARGIQAWEGVSVGGV